MKKETRDQQLIKLAKEWGSDYQVIHAKVELINTIKKHCKTNGISQRKLASLVKAPSQDRVSKIFSGQVGHMSLDKLIQILSNLGIKVGLKIGSK